MPLISTSLPNLSGGVSQQPSTQRLENQCEAQENAIPLLIGGLVKRPPTEFVSQLRQSGGATLNLSGAFVHFIQRDEDEKYILSVKPNGELNVYDLNGDHETVYFSGASGSPSVMPYIQDSTQSTIRATTIGDVTFLLNTAATVGMLADTSPIETAEYEALLWIKSSAQGLKIKVTVQVAGATEYYIEVKHEPHDISGTGAGTHFLDPSFPSTSDVAAALVSGNSSDDLVVTTDILTGGLNGIDDLGVDVKGSVIYLDTGTTGKNFTVTVEDHFGGEAHATLKSPVGEFSDLPGVAKDGMVFLVQGDPETEVDDYYVKFETNGLGGFAEGLWVETVAPEIKYKLDPTTLPVILVRQANDTWQVKHADGVVPTGNTYGDIDWASFKFADRTAGSELTNPLPSFVNKKISDMNYFKGRLVFLSGENCSLSETGEFFNFFRTTVTQLPDTAPIDVGVGGRSINKLKRSQPFSDRLVLFSELTQFVLQGVPLLTPKTATITEVTNFSASTLSSPSPSGNTLFFAFNRGDYSGVREFYKTGETELNYDAVESSSQIPKYIEGEIKTLTSSSQEDFLIVRASPSNTLYAFKFFKTEQGRAQAAWFKMTFTDTEILEVDFIQEHLYMVTLRNGESWLERINFQTGLVDGGASYVTSLDNRILVTGDGANSPSGGFTLNLTNDARPDYSFTTAQQAAVQVVSEDGEIMSIASTATEGGNPTITLEEEFGAADKFYVGLPYTMLYEVTKPTLKQARQSGGVETVATGRHQLRYMTVVYDDTAFFKVKVTQLIADKDGDTIEYPFSGRFLSTGGYLGVVPSASGTFRFPVFAQSDEIKIEIENDSPLPSNIQSIAFEAQYTSRSTRM